MSSDHVSRGPTSPAHDAFEVIFQAADLWASIWSPMLKGAGRWQLEMSQLAAKQARAAMTLGQRLARSENTDHMVDAYREYWYDVGGFYSDASRNIATALVRAAPHSAVLQLPLTRVHTHDRMQLIDTPERAEGHERKVA